VPTHDGISAGTLSTILKPLRCATEQSGSSAKRSSTIDFDKRVIFCDMIGESVKISICGFPSNFNENPLGNQKINVVELNQHEAMIIEMIMTMTINEPQPPAAFGLSSIS